MYTNNDNNIQSIRFYRRTEFMYDFNRNSRVFVSIFA